VVLLRERTDGLREQDDLTGRDGELTAPGAQHLAGDPDPVAQIQIGHEREGLLAEHVQTAEHLDLVCTVADHEEQRLALVPLGDHAPGDRDNIVGLATCLKVGMPGQDVFNAVGALEAVSEWFDTSAAELRDLGDATRRDLVGRSCVDT